MPSYGYTGSIEFETTTAPEVVTITAAGGAGGAGYAGGRSAPAHPGGDGGVVSGTFYLAADTELEIVVGGQGKSSLDTGGGGGGTFVFEVENGNLVPLLVAGGGGGGGNVSHGTAGNPGGSGNVNGGNGGHGYGFEAGAGGTANTTSKGGYEIDVGTGGGGLNGNGGSSEAELHSSFKTYAGGGGPPSFAGSGAEAGSGNGGFGGGGGLGGGGGGGGFRGGGGGGGGINGYTSGGGGGGSSYVSASSLFPAILNGGVEAGGGYVETSGVLCFLRGTRVLTPTGELSIESLAIGDPVVTRAGACPIRWIGRQSYDRRFIAQNSDKMPVCIRAHALGENIPARDLYVTPGHSLLIDTTLVLARNLVNGVTITNDWAPARIDYFNIELAHHECIRAEGCWAETFAEGDGLRSAFHNEAEYHALYPDSVGGKTLSLCAPRFLRGAGLEAALRPIVARCQSLVKPGPLRGYIDGTQEGRIEGWAQDSSHPELPVLLEVWAGGRLLGTVLACDERHDLREAGIARGLCAFTFTTDAELKDVRVRRSGDGAALAMTVDCRMKAA